MMNKDFHIAAPLGPVHPPLDDPLLPLVQPTGTEDDFLFSLAENDWEIGGGDSPEDGQFWSK